MTQLRKFTPYEQTQLGRYGHIPSGGDPFQLPETDTTPVEYLTGKAEFCGLVLNVSPEVLIPRLETEELVERAIEFITAALALKTTELPLQLLDVGTGCGAVPCALAARFSPEQLTLTGSEVSATALEVARQNDPAGRVTWLESDVLDQVPNLGYTLITANLPYIPSERIPYLDASVSAHEPHVALDGGSDGLQLIRKLLNQAPSFLVPQGKVILEVDYTHTITDFSLESADWKLEFSRDSFDRQRFIELVCT